MIHLSNVRKLKILTTYLFGYGRLASKESTAVFVFSLEIKQKTHGGSCRLLLKMEYVAGKNMSFKKDNINNTFMGSDKAFGLFLIRPILPSLVQLVAGSSLVSRVAAFKSSPNKQREKD